MHISDDRGRISEDVTLTHQKQVELAHILKQQGHSNASIAYIMRINEPIVRILLTSPK